MAMKKKADRDGVKAVFEEKNEDLDFSELQVADHVVFISAVSTYIQWLRSLAVESPDSLVSRAFTLIRGIDRKHKDRIVEFLQQGLPLKAALVAAAMNQPIDFLGIGRRSYVFRNLLSPTRGEQLAASISLVKVSACASKSLPPWALSGRETCLTS